MHTLAQVAERIESGTPFPIAIKEHVDAWKRQRTPEIFQSEPLWVDEPVWLNVWLAGAAEYESFLLGMRAPDWTMNPIRFLREPLFFGGKNARKDVLTDTPFAWRKRMLFIGTTTIS